jgi:hypothetical protein
MAKIPSKGSSKKSGGEAWSMRDARTGKFTLGRSAFTSISSVEGITPSRAMIRDLDRTERLSPARRRSELTDKYGKK